MSGGITATQVLAAAAVAGVAGTVYNGIEQSKNAKSAAATATANAKKTAADSERATNAAGAKAPDVAALLSGAEAAAKGGAGSTMLTGPSGIDPSALKLGKSTLLGG